MIVSRGERSMKRSLLPASLFLVLAAVLTASAQQPPSKPLDPERFEAEFRAFEQADRATPPPEHPIVFVGSSSIRRWDTLAKDFPGLPVLNRGFGGSEASDVLRHASRVILPYRPSRVVFYAGDNDLARGKTPAAIAADVKALWELLSRQPQAKMSIISVKPSLARWSLVSQTRETNELLRRFAASDPRLTYIDVFTPMIGPDGKPVPAHFVEDGLHLTPAGYRIWTTAVAPFLK
jgi:lysophospholipase L1-like esterase